MQASDGGKWPKDMELMKYEEKPEESVMVAQEMEKNLLYLSQGKRETFREYSENIKRVFLT